MCGGGDACRFGRFTHTITGDCFSFRAYSVFLPSVSIAENTTHARGKCSGRPAPYALSFPAAICMHTRFQPRKSVVHRRSRTGDVHAEKSAPVSTVNRACGKVESRFASDKMRKVVRVVGDFRTVEPQKIGRVRRNGKDFGNFIFNKFAHRFFIFENVRAKFVEPCPAFRKCRRSSDAREYVGLRDFVGVELTIDLRVKLGIF